MAIHNIIQYYDDIIHESIRLYVRNERVLIFINLEIGSN